MGLDGLEFDHQIPPRRALLGVLGIAVLAGGLTLSIWFASREIWPAWAALLGFGLTLILAVGAAHEIEHRSLRLEQHGRNLKANEILGTLWRGEEAEPFCLYLRSAQLQETMAQEAGGLISTGLRPLTYFEHELEFEDELYHSVKRIGPLVALGEPFESLGAGKIKIDEENYPSAVRMLMAAAEWIILLPSADDISLWEIEQLHAAGYFKKTILLEPPAAETETVADNEEAAQSLLKAFARAGYNLAGDEKFLRSGRLFYFDRQAEPVLERRLTPKIASFIRKIQRYNATSEGA